MTYKNILIGCDGSPESLNAFKRAIEIAKNNDSRLFIANVIKRQHVNTESVALGFGIAEIDIDIQDAINQRQKLLDELKQKAISSGINEVKTILKIGSPKLMLSYDIVNENKIDLEVVGATGLGKVAQVLIGSTATFVVENSKSDVIVVKN